MAVAEFFEQRDPELQRHGISFLANCPNPFARNVKKAFKHKLGVLYVVDHLLRGHRKPWFGGVVEHLEHYLPTMTQCCVECTANHLDAQLKLRTVVAGWRHRTVLSEPLRRHLMEVVGLPANEVSVSSTETRPLAESLRGHEEGVGSPSLERDHTSLFATSSDRTAADDDFPVPVSKRAPEESPQSSRVFPSRAAQRSPADIAGASRPSTSVVGDASMEADDSSQHSEAQSSHNLAVSSRSSANVAVQGHGRKRGADTALETTTTTQRPTDSVSGVSSHTVAPAPVPKRVATISRTRMCDPRTREKMVATVVWSDSKRQGNGKESLQIRSFDQIMREKKKNKDVQKHEAH